MKRAILILLFFMAMDSISFANRDEMRTIDSLSRLLEKQTGNHKIRTLQSLIEHYRSIAPAKSIQLGETALNDQELAKNPEAQAIILRSIAASAHYAGDLELSEQYLRRAILLSRMAGNMIMTGHLLTDAGNQFQRQGRFDEAKTALNEALKIAQDVGNDTIAMQAYIILGNTAFESGDFHLALEHYGKTTKLADKLKDEEIRAKTLLNMGMANWQFDNNDIAISMLMNAAGLFRKLNDMHSLGMVYNNIGLIYFSDIQQFDSASFYFNASLRIREQLSSPIPIAHVLVNQANLLVAQHQFDEAIRLYDRAMQIFTNAGMRLQLIRVLYHLGEVWQRMGHQEAAAARFEDALANARESGIETYESLARLKLLDIYAEAGNWKAFKEHFAYFRAQHDRLHDDYKAASVREIQLEDKLTEAQRAIDMLETQNQQLKKRVKLLESIFISLATVIASTILLLISRRLILRLMPSR
ncbi:MAG TPA: tetratricopeptide repeat protein [Bacteroidales bacterium]|nr:tetratricopeptide repeat protein [Bacteroidales bacterium]